MTEEKGRIGAAVRIGDAARNGGAALIGEASWTADSASTDGVTRNDDFSGRRLRTSAFRES